MVGYKLSKNDWVTPFFVIFRSVREILLVTVFCKHPVVDHWWTTAICNKRPRWLVGNAALHKKREHTSDISEKFSTNLILRFLAFHRIFNPDFSKFFFWTGHKRLICLQAIKGPESNLEKQFYPITHRPGTTISKDSNIIPMQHK